MSQEINKLQTVKKVFYNKMMKISNINNNSCNCKKINNRNKKLMQ